MMTVNGSLPADAKPADLERAGATYGADDLGVLYSCPQCGIVRAAVRVPYRAREQDIGAWMDDLGRRMSEDHHSRSPHCVPKTLADIFIPHGGGAQWIGGRRLQ